MRIVVCAVLLLSGAAQAQVVGTRAAGMGGAYIPIANDASALWHNPAGLAWVGGGTKLSLSANAYSYTGATIDDYFAIGSHLEPADRDRANLKYSSVSSYPSSLFNAYPLSADEDNRHVIALGMIIPQDYAMSGGVLVRPGDMPLNLQYEFANQAREYVAGLGYGYRLGDSLSIGVFLGASIYTETYEETRNRATDGFDPKVIDVRTLTRHFDLMALSLAASIGVQYRLGDLWIGGVVRPPGVPMMGRFTLRFSQTEMIDGHGKQDTIEVPADSASYSNPMSFGIGIGYQSPKSFAVSLQGVLTMADERVVFPRYTIVDEVNGSVIATVPGREIKTKQTLNVSAGLELWLADWLPLRVGGFFKPNNRVDPDLPDPSYTFVPPSVDGGKGQWLPNFDTAVFGQPYTDQIGGTIGFGLLSGSGIGTDVGILFTMNKGYAVGEGIFIDPQTNDADAFYPVPNKQDFVSYTFALFIGGTLDVDEEADEKKDLESTTEVQQ